MTRRALVSFGWFGFLSSLCTMAAAQSLSDQYENYLDAKCARMNFQRDDNANLLPGQAGPHLFSYCTGPFAEASAAVDYERGIDYL